MKSYKNWKLVNESVLPGMNLGITHPQTIGGLRSNLPGVSLSEKKKMHGDVVRDDEPEDVDVDDVDVDDDDDGGDDHECSCKHKKEKEIKFSKKKCNKKMKKKMSDDMDLSDDEVDDEADDVNDVETPDDDDSDEGDWEDSDEGDEEDSDEDEGEEGGDDWEDSDSDDEDEDGGDDAPKFGFMKDKKKDWKKKGFAKKKGWDKKSKKEKKVEEQFWNDLSNYHVPKNEKGTDQEFFDSLARQYGNPKIRFHGGVDRVDEDLLLSPDQQALIDSMPKPGEVGFGPQQRIGGGFAPSEQPDMDYVGYGENTDYEEAVEESADYEVLCKYFSEDVARSLIEKKRGY